MSAAPAPASKIERSQDAPGPIVNTLAEGKEWWQGMSIVEARKKLAEMRVAGADLSTSGVTSLDQLVPLSDDGLYEIFTNGVPDVPGRLPGDEGGDSYAFANTSTDTKTKRTPTQTHTQRERERERERETRGYRGRSVRGERERERERERVCPAQ
jgi:hypothetical protein